MRAAAVIVSLALAACGGDDAPACRVGADCASGACRADGTCAPLDTDAGDPDRDAGPLSDAGGDFDAGGPGDAGSPIDAGSLTCVPNDDGTIDRDEVPIAAGLRATFRIATGAMWSTAGDAQPDGSRRWDLSGALTGDHDALVETLSPEGQWWSPRFAGATYAARIADENDLLGVFEARADALLLRGVVSPTDGPSRTELSYDPPVVVLQFPLREGATWSTDSVATGTTSGIPGTYVMERYDTQVDAHGTLATPFASFDVLRVRVVLTRTVGFVPTTIRSFVFATECFGTVATVRARDNEPSTEFTRAAEARRLAP